MSNAITADDSVESVVETKDPDWYFFVYDEDEEDPRYSVWVQGNAIEIPVFSHQPDETCEWMDLRPSYGAERVAMSDDCKTVLSELLVAGETELFDELPPWERSFVNGIFEQAQTDDGLPNPVKGLVSECIEKYE